MEVTPDHHPEVPISATPRINSCPGSMQLVKKAPPIPASTDAEEGSLCHECIDDARLLDKLDEEQSSAVLWVREHWESKIASYREIHICHEVERVLRLEDKRPVTWGRIDIEGFVPSPEKVVIYDAKFGRIPITRESVELQMRAYAAAAMQEHAVNQAEVWVGQPRLRAELFGAYSHPYQIARDIFNVIDYANRNPHKLVPGSVQCRYCPAKTICPEFDEKILLPATRPSIDSSLPMDRLVKALDVIPLIEKWIEDIRGVARRTLEGGGVVPGWELGDREWRKVVSVDKAFGAVAGVLTQEEFLKIAEVGIGKLEAAFGEKGKAIGVFKSKAAAVRRLEELLGDAVKRISSKILRRKE